ncbi:MAG: PilN domain-containing protein [bacterium]
MPEIDKINLIPADIIEKRIIAHTIKKGIMLSLLFILCLILVGIKEHSYLKKVERKVERLRLNHNKLKAVDKDLILSHQNVTHLLEEKINLLDLMNKSYITPILFDLSTIINEDSRLTKFSVKQESADNVIGAKKNTPIITIEGITKSYQNLSDFLLVLQNQDSFKNVTLLKTDIHTAQKSYIDFEISAEYQSNHEKDITH